jgi:hypothetical protein
MKSILEQESDTLLKIFCTEIKKKLTKNDEKLSLTPNSNFFNICDELSPSFIDERLDTNDYEYLYFLLKHNDVNPSNKEPLNRPSLKKYSIDTEEDRTEYVTYTYQSKFYSYLDEQNDILNHLRTMESDGNFSYMDGVIVNTDYGDGDTNDVRIEYNTLTLIE